VKILISGVAGDIGVGISRILQEWGVFSRLYGMDINPNHYASLILDECITCPRANDESYISWLTSYISKNEIGLFIPTSEAELGVLAERGLYKIGGAKILSNSQFIIKKCLDKFECLEYLSSNGIKVPEHGVVGDKVPSCFPVIVKPQRGQGSKGIVLVDSLEKFDSCLSDNLVWQGYLQPEDEEYTCAVYSSSSSEVRTLMMKRKLVGGLTGSGEVVDNKTIDEYVRSIAKVMDLEGAFNVQLRLTENGPRLFEINPRLSSTVVFRDLLGFQDLRWWVSDVLGLDVSFDMSLPIEGTRFFRGSKEYILPSLSEG